MRVDQTEAVAKREDSALGLTLLILLAVCGGVVFCFFPVL